MNDTYFDEFVLLLERIFSYAYNKQYSLDVVEKEISNSYLFQIGEKQRGVIVPYIDEVAMINKIFGESPDDLSSIPTYKECAWAAESYCYIQKETKLTFEAIFLYIPIEKMYEYFPIYHEMDFFHIMNEFSRLFFKASVLSILIEKRSIPIRYISRETNMSYASIFSYKKRRRDIKKMSAEAACILANMLNVRIETLLEFFN